MLDFFLATCDSFIGTSGAPLLQATTSSSENQRDYESFELVGFIVRGQVDFTQESLHENCRRINTINCEVTNCGDNGRLRSELVEYAFHAVTEQPG